MKKIDIKKFDEFSSLYENENADTVLVNFFASLARNYETQRPFYTDMLQFIVDEERRDWRDTRKYVKLEKKVEHEAFYKLKFTMDNKHYLLEINFDFTFYGQEDRDAPEAMTEEDKDRLNIVLESIKVEKIKILSTDFDLTKQNKEISSPVKRACEAFLVKMLEADYDTVGAELYKIEAE